MLRLLSQHINPTFVYSLLDGRELIGRTLRTAGLAKPLPHAKIGVTTVRDVRNAGGDVIKTSGSSANHATLTGLTPKKTSQLLNPPIPNPNKTK